MGNARDNSYEEMEEALSKYAAKVTEQVNIMKTAATDCIDNTDGDEAAKISAENLSKCIAGVSEPLERIQMIIKYLRDEMEKIKDAANKAKM